MAGTEYNKYVDYEGTSFRKGTPDQIKEIISMFMHSGTRLRLCLGDAVTGRDWEEEHDVEGYIGRSTGSIKVPILLANARSHGGGEILTTNIVKIQYANKKQGGVLYQHPNYHIRR